ncbi:MAG: IS3 family transposase [Mycobacteriaceae bacterium]
MQDTALHPNPQVSDPLQHHKSLEITVAEYIEWFNHRRLHGEIGMVPPVEYEQQQYYSENPVMKSTKTTELSLHQTRSDSPTSSDGPNSSWPWPRRTASRATTRTTITPAPAPASPRP